MDRLDPKGDFIRDTRGNSVIDYQPPGIAEAKPGCPLTLTPDGKARILVEWEVSSNPMMLKAREFLTVIQLRATADLQIVFWMLRYLPPIPKKMRVWAAPFFQTAGHGKRRLRVRRLGGPARIVALENLPTGFVNTEEAIDGIQNVCEAWPAGHTGKDPQDYWCFSRAGWGSTQHPNQLLLQKGQCFGLVAMSNCDVRCIGKVAGV